MARAYAASVSASAGTLHGLAQSLQPRRRLRHLTSFEPILRRLIPVLVLIFVSSLVVGVVVQLREARSRAIADAVGDLELVAAVVSDEFNASIAARPQIAAADLIAQDLPGRALTGDRTIYISDAAGLIVGSLPSRPVTSQNLADRLGVTQPLTTFAEKAGVMQITLADGREALATVHALRAPFGQVAIVDPLNSLLVDWWSSSCRSVFLLLATTGVLLVLAGAFLWQAGRALAADASHALVHGRIDTALNQGRCGLWDWDLARGRIYWSESMYAMLGLEPKAGFVSFGDLKSMLHPEDEAFPDLADLLSHGPQGSVLDRSFQLRDARGAWVWLRIRAVIKRDGRASEPHLVGIAIDVSDEKARAEQTKAANERLRDAVEELSEAFVLWDASNQLVTCNSRFLKLHELLPHLAQPGTPYSEVIAQARPPSIKTSLPVSDTQGGNNSSYEAQLADGRWLQVNERRTKDGGFVSVGTDITALKRHEEQLMDSERRLMAMVADLRRSRRALETQAQQLAELAERHAEKKAEAESANMAKSEFLANMSHELRTPLNAILGFSEMMIGEVFGPLGSERYAAYANDIRKSGQQLLDVISDVLEMARLESGRVRLDRSQFGVEQAIGEAVDRYRPMALAKNLRLVSEVDPDLDIDADRSALIKAVDNLIANAVRYTPEGGKITVRARAANGSINLFVEDNGIGIAPAALNRIGKPFEQVDATLLDGMKGSGLGLAIVRSIVELHGGSLRIRSVLGEGTIVMAHLPNTGSAHVVPLAPTPVAA